MGNSSQHRLVPAGAVEDHDAAARSTNEGPVLLDGLVFQASHAGPQVRWTPLPPVSCSTRQFVVIDGQYRQFISQQQAQMLHRASRRPALVWYSSRPVEVATLLMTFVKK